MAKITENKDFIKFMGTAGARFVMIKQLRSSGGLWINACGKNIVFDPGPGCIVKCNKSRPRLSPDKLDAIILSHKHLDHCSDINVMIEAMTDGGFKKRGIVFCPTDALDHDPVILQYFRKLPQEVIPIKELSTYKIGDFEFKTSMRHKHSVETYGIKFNACGKSVSILTDTKYFQELRDFYKTDILIMSVVFFDKHDKYDHLSLYDAKQILADVKPKKAVLTHFGMTMLAHKPDLIAEDITKELGIETIAAYDGMTLEIA